MYIYIYVYHGPPKPTFLEVFYGKVANTFFCHGFGGRMVYNGIYTIIWYMIHTTSKVDSNELSIAVWAKHSSSPGSEEGTEPLDDVRPLRKWSQHQMSFLAPKK